MRFAPGSTVFVLLSFEGPDVYSQAGGLGVRMKEMARALAGAGFETHLFFVGDPAAASIETVAGGRLTYHRWEQWLSALHPAGVYDGEDAKLWEWNRSLPGHLVDAVVAPAAAAGRNVVVLAEEWHTATSVNILWSGLQHARVRQSAVLLWNANNVYGFDRVDWRALNSVATVTTVSRYMKARMAGLAEAAVVPNGIPASAFEAPPPASIRATRAAADADLLLFKIGRFDPDKRWLMAVAAVGELKRRGHRVRLMMRGGREPHGPEVLGTAAAQGLSLASVPSPAGIAELQTLLRTEPADVLNFTTFLPESMLAPLYASSDAVLANSGFEPFGLVGLEVMAAGGLAVTGGTGEDYARGFHNALVVETSDPRELAAGLERLRAEPALRTRICEAGRLTAREYTWDRVIDELMYRVEVAAGAQLGSQA